MILALVLEIIQLSVLGKAVRAAKKTGMEFGVIVTPSTGRYWHGLIPVEPKK
jgi:uncharacterized membrane protein (DUF441 family)